MQNVTMPNGDVVSFPADMPAEEIKSLIQSKFPQETSVESRVNMNRGEGGLRSALQGMTFGFGDELVAGAGAIPQALIGGQSIPDAYNQILQGERQKIGEFKEQSPKTAIATEIGGALGTGLAGAATKAGASIASSLGRGGLGARAGKGALAGTASGGLYGYGTGEGQERLQSAGQGALIGGATGGIIPVAGAGLSRLNTKTIIPNAEKIRAKAGQLYQKAEQKGGLLKPEFTNQFVDDIQSLKPQTDIGRIASGDSPFTKVVDRISEIKDRPMSLLEAQELDEYLGEAIDDFVDMGKLTKQGKKLFDIQTSLRQSIDDVSENMIEGGKEGFEAWKEAKKLWSTSMRMADIEKIIERADMYEQPATALKTGFRTLYNNKNRLRGFSKEEQEAIKKAAESGVVTDVLKTAGSRLVPIIAGTTGGLGVGAIGAGASMASRGGAARMQLGRAQNVANMIAKDSGLTKTQKRLSLQNILNLPPKEAKKLLRNTSQSTAITQGNK